MVGAPQGGQASTAARSSRAPRLALERLRDGRLTADPSMSEQTKPRLLPLLVATSIAALLAVPGSYAILRAYDVLFKNEPNPATIVWSAHIAMFWRLAVGGYIAGMIVPLGYVAARRDLARTMKALEVIVVVVAVMIGVQGLLMP